MKILINEANKELITQELEKIHGKAQNHLLDYEQILAIKARAEQFERKFLKKHLPGFCLYWATNETKANVYKYKYAADEIWLKWSKEGWYISHIKRGEFYPNSPDKSRFYWELKKGKEETHEEVYKRELAHMRELAEYLLINTLNMK